MNAPIAPEPRALPFVGHAPWLLGDAMAFLSRVRREHGPIFRVRVGPFRYLMVHTPAAVHQVLVEHAGAYEKGAGLDGLRPFVGRGLITSEGELWRRERRVLQPAFSHRSVERSVAVMAEVAEACAAGLERHVGTLVDAHDEMLRLALRVAARALFDFDAAADEEVITRVLEGALRYAIELGILPPLVPLWVPTPRNVKLRRLVAELDGVAQRILGRARRPETEDALALLLAVRDELGPALLRDEVLTLLLAGHETTAAALSWTLALLALHPEARRRAEAEAFDALADRRVTAADLPRLPFLAAVVEESMRLYPPVWWIERQAIADDVVGGYAVPRGSFVAVSTMLLHRDRELWPEPDRFRPERFLDGTPPRFGYLPFGLGARMCIGAGFARAELCVILATLLRRFRFDFPRGRPPRPPGDRLPAEMPRAEHLITLRPRGLRMRLGRSHPPG